jgi:hypothetical protein
MSTKQNKEVFLGGGHNLNMRSSSLVTTQQTLTLLTSTHGSIQLSVDIQADFDSIPEEYREVFLNMMSVKYLGVVSFGDNPFSQCLPAPKKRWWQIWKQ